MILFTQEQVSSRISEVVDWSLIKAQSLFLFKNNIHIVTFNAGYTGQAFRHSGGKKMAEFCKTDESIKSIAGGCIFFNVLLLIRFYHVFS